MREYESNRIDVIAREFAIEAHANAGVMYGKHPFSYHLDAVASALQDFGHDDPKLLAAAYLHDVVEDTPVTLDQIEGRFHAVVRDYVDAVTDIKIGPDGQKLLNRKSRQVLTYAKTREIATRRGDPVINLKLADRIANFEESIFTVSHHLGMYRTEHAAFIDQIKPAGGDPAMWLHLDHLVEIALPLLDAQTMFKAADRAFNHQQRVAKAKAMRLASQRATTCRVCLALDHTAAEHDAQEGTTTPAPTGTEDHSDWTRRMDAGRPGGSEWRGS